MAGQRTKLKSSRDHCSLRRLRRAEVLLGRAVRLERAQKRIKPLLIRNGACNGSVYVFDENVRVPEFPHSAGYCAGVVFELMKGWRIQERLQGPVRGAKTGQAHAQLMHALGYICFERHGPIPDNLLSRREENFGEGCAASLARFYTRWLGLCRRQIRDRLRHFKEKAITPFRLAHRRQLHGLIGEKLLGDSEQGLWIALDELELRLTDRRLSSFGPRLAPIQSKLNDAASGLQFVGGPRYDSFEGPHQRGAVQRPRDLAAQAFVADALEIGLGTRDWRLNLYRVGKPILESGVRFDGLDETRAIIADAQRHPKITEPKIGRVIVDGFQDFL